MPLPVGLLFLLEAALVAADIQQLALNQLYSFSSESSNPATYSLPSSSTLSVSAALCSSYGPRFFVSNDSSITPGPNNLGQNVYEILLGEYGLGNWTGSVPTSGILAVYNATDTSFEIGVSENGSMHAVLDSLPYFGDTTNNQVMLFSPPFDPPTFSQPTYPNYTLPPANFSFPSSPSSPPSYSIFLAPTSSTFSSIPRTGCALKNASINDSVYETSDDSLGLWLRSEDGWRWQWLVNGLASLTNYTAYAIEDETKTAGPIYFATKSAGFACPIVHSLPFCPSVSYAAPVTAADPAAGASVSDLPSDFTEILLSGLTNFTVMLTTTACGRDMYSPIVTCADCQAAYRSWLCLVSLPRCAEYPANDTLATTSASAQQAVVTPALQAQSATAQRNSALGNFTEDYLALLPCLEACNAADRACPYFLGFKCPLPKYTAAYSYGVGYIDSGENGVVGGGLTGVAQDQWGNVWCNDAGIMRVADGWVM